MLSQVLYTGLHHELQPMSKEGEEESLSPGCRRDQRVQVKEGKGIHQTELLELDPLCCSLDLVTLGTNPASRP